MAVGTYSEDAVSAKHVHDYDEYMLVTAAFGCPSLCTGGRIRTPRGVFTSSGNSDRS
jgi:hypothetical protein